MMYERKDIMGLKWFGCRWVNNVLTLWSWYTVLVLIVVCVFGGFGERVRAADGFVFACADIRLHATAGICPLDLRESFRFLAQRWIVRVLESDQ